MNLNTNYIIQKLRNKFQTIKVSIVYQPTYQTNSLVHLLNQFSIQLYLTVIGSKSSGDE